MKVKRTLQIFSIVFLSFLTSFCSPSENENNNLNGLSNPPDINENISPNESEPITIISGNITEQVEYAQWAAEANASTEYSSPSWAAIQVIGEPNVFQCGDNAKAWASSSNDGVEWIDVFYSTPVYAKKVLIVESYNPGHISKVELIDMNGTLHEVFNQPPSLANECPFSLQINFDQTNYFVNGVRVTLDLSVLKDWNEIDAIQLVGMVDPDSIIEPPNIFASEFDLPKEYRWRVSGAELNSGAFGGMDTDSNNLIYIADAFNGVWVFDEQGVVVNEIVHEDIINASDVKIGPNGEVIIASWGSNEIFVFSSTGQYLRRFGEVGGGEGDFGNFYPQKIAVGSDGTVYALDKQEDSNGDPFDRIISYSLQGNFLRSWSIDEQFFGATSLAIGPNGYLFVVGFIGDYIVKYNSTGKVIDRIGQGVLNFTGPQMIDIDDAGNIYLTIWTEAGVLKLDSDGNLISRFGFEVELGKSGWPEGGFYQPMGVAVLGDGSIVFASDYNGEHYFIQAFEID